MDDKGKERLIEIEEPLEMELNEQDDQGISYQFLFLFFLLFFWGNEWND